MAIDTVVLESPYINNQLADLVDSFCDRHIGVDLGHGRVKYNITRGMLEGSYDHRVSIQVRRHIFVKGKFDKIPHKEDSLPFIRLEGSIHKAMLGHNIYGGPCDFQASCRWFLDFVSYLLGNVQLPDWKTWVVKRVDVAEIYKMWSLQHVTQWFKEMLRAEFPRRSAPRRYGYQSLYFAGASTTLKFYHKVWEFLKHDKVRLKKFLDDKALIELRLLSEQILRVEVEVKEKKLEYDRKKFITDIDEKYLNGVHDMEVRRLLKEGASDLTPVREAKSVEGRLFDVYKPAKAGRLLGLWYRLAAMGEQEVKVSMPSNTFYTNKRDLVKAGISWEGSDVLLKNYSLIPEDFSPVRTDIRRFSEVHPDVQEMLKKYQVA